MAGRDDEVLLRRLASELLVDVEQIADEVSRRVLKRHPALASLQDAAALDAVRRSTTANVGAVLSTLAFGVPADSVDPPVGVLDLVDHVARHPDGLPVLLRAYRLGAAETWQILARHLGAQVTEADSLARLVLVASAHIDGYADHIAELLTERWSEVSDEAARSGRRRVAALRDLLRGEDVHLEALDHPFDRHHVAVAARVTDGTPARALQAALGEIAGRLAGAATIRLEEADGLHLQWFSLRTRPDRKRIDRLLVAVPDGVHLAVSDVAGGVDGFVTVAGDARDALQAVIRLRPAGGSVAYRQVALAAALFAHPARAERLAKVVLGPLAEPTPEAERLRATLHAYFRCQSNKAAAGAELHLHEKTVAYRLRRAAELLGAPIDDRRAELEAALLVLQSGDS